MNDYQELIKTEAKKFYEAQKADFEADAGEFGAKSAQPNFSKWVDRTARLNQVVEAIASKWAHKDFFWVQQNTRNRNPKGGGDPRSNAFGSFYLDVFHQVKKLAKRM